MNEKDIKLIIKQQLIPTGNVCLRKKIIVKEISDAVIAEYCDYDKELIIPIEELIGNCKILNLLLEKRKNTVGRLAKGRFII